VSGAVEFRVGTASWTDPTGNEIIFRFMNRKPTSLGTWNTYGLFVAEVEARPLRTSRQNEKNVNPSVTARPFLAYAVFGAASRGRRNGGLDVANESVADIGHWRSFPLGATTRC
jgi:hypothetical protein